MKAGVTSRGLHGVLQQAQAFEVEPNWTGGNAVRMHVGDRSVSAGWHVMGVELAELAGGRMKSEI